MNRVLIISISLNVLLIAAVAVRFARSPGPAPRELRSAPETAAVSRSKSPRALPSAVMKRADNFWQALDDPDTRTFIANLRAAGCPERTIRDIVMLRVSRSYREQLVQSQAELQSRLTGNHIKDMAEHDKANELRAELRLRMQNELESLLGADWESLVSEQTGWPMGDDGFKKELSPEKRAQLRQIEKDFSTRMSALTTKQFSPDFGHSDKQAMEELERQKRAALAAVLSPEEFEEYLYRESPAARYVLQSAPAAKDEAEYRRMVKLALELGMSDLDSNKSVHRFTYADDQLNAEMEERKKTFSSKLNEVLGNERLAEEKAAEEQRTEQEAKAQDERNRQEMLMTMTEKAAELGMSAQDAERFHSRLTELEPELNKRFKEFETSFTGTPEEIQKQIEAAGRAELNKIATEVLGEKGPALVEKMFKH
jgi:hypothetical protein